MLVSICVISYNSALTIIETLDSVINQTYDLGSIELIICDDHSSDDTPAIIKCWVEKNKIYFSSIICIISDVNNGVTKNCDAAVRHASGDWIKLIAGDDILHPDCIKNNISYVNDNQEAKVVFSIQEKFGCGVSVTDGNRMLPSSYDKRFFDLSADEQLSWLTIESLSNTPTSFISRELLQCIGFFDTNFRNIEDYPLWVRLSLSGTRFFYFDKVTVYYRVGDSVSRPNKELVNLRYFHELYSFEEKHVFNLMSSSYKRKLKILWYFLLFKLIKVFDNERNLCSLFLYRCLLVIKPGVLKKKLFERKWGW